MKKESTAGNMKYKLRVHKKRKIKFSYSIIKTFSLLILFHNVFEMTNRKREARIGSKQNTSMPGVNSQKAKHGAIYEFFF